MASVEAEEISEHLIHRERGVEGPVTFDPVRDGERLESGLRAARIGSVLAHITAGFSDPDFSTRVLAARLGLSVRYVQDLMQDSGVSVTERILQLRLKKAHAMLLNDRRGNQRISEIATSCGFNEVSYFHRCFRRHFGAPPAKVRAAMLREQPGQDRAWL